MKFKDPDLVANGGKQGNGRAKEELKLVRNSSVIKDTCVHKVSGADKGKTCAGSGKPVEGVRRDHDRESRLAGGN